MPCRTAPHPTKPCHAWPTRSSWETCTALAWTCGRTAVHWPSWRPAGRCFPGVPPLTSYGASRAAWAPSPRPRWHVWEQTRGWQAWRRRCRRDKAGTGHSGSGYRCVGEAVAAGPIAKFMPVLYCSEPTSTACFVTGCFCRSCRLRLQVYRREGQLCNIANPVLNPVPASCRR